MTHLVRGGGALPDLVRSVASAIADKLGYGVVVVSLFRADTQDYVAADCVGSSDAGRELIGRVSSSASWEELLVQATLVVGDAYFLAAEGTTWAGDGMPSWVPASRHADSASAWNAHDALVVRLRDSTDQTLGFISVDEPSSGRRPSKRDLEALSAFCAHLASALEMANVNAVNRRQNRALARLAELSTETRHTADPVELLGGLATAAVETLALELVEIQVVRDAAQRTVAQARADAPAVTAFPWEATATVDVGYELHDLNGAYLGVMRVRGRELPGTEEAARRQLLRTFADAAQAVVSSALHRRVVLADARKQVMLDASRDAIVTSDDAGRVVEFNAAAETIFGYPADQVVGRPLAELLVPERFRTQHRADVAALHGGEQFEVLAMRADGTEFPAEISVGRAEWEQTSLTISYVRDITAQREAETELRRQRSAAEHAADHDEVTGLLNQRGLCHTFRRGAPAPALLSLTVEEVTAVYEAFGAVVGDAMMQTLAGRIADAAEAHGAVLARAGAADFSLVCSEDALDALAASCREVVHRSIEVQGILIALSCRLGAACDPADDLEEMLRRAVVARGSDETHTTTWHLPRYEQYDDTAVARLRAASDLRRAIDAGDLELHYQPLYGVVEGSLYALEALVRWRAADGGLIPPLDFIPLAEATGLIAPLAEWVLEEAARQITAWSDAGLEVPPVSVNLSPHQLPHHDVCAVIRRTLERWELAPGALFVEVTESALQVGDGRMERTLLELADIGVRCALDDFGADYSSLTRLATLPFHMVKLDRSFLAAVPSDPRATALFSAIAGVAQALGLQTTAEGVETDGQWETLRSTGIDVGQGFLFGRPHGAGETTRLLSPRAPGADDGLIGLASSEEVGPPLPAAHLSGQSS